MGDYVIEKATSDQLERIAAVGESIIGSRTRYAILQKAIANGECYVIRIQDSIAAYAVFSYRFYENGFISLLVVAKEYQRKGLGRAMVEGLKALCSTKKLFTSTNVSNTPMQRLLEKCGFRRSGFIDNLDEGDPELVYCFLRKPGAHLNRRIRALPKGRTGKVEIIKLAWEHLPDINSADNRFMVTARLIPQFREGCLTYTTLALEHPYEKHYPNEEADYSRYIDHPDREVFLAYMNGSCVGQVILRRNWNRYAYIEDIRVKSGFRKRGIGRKLIDAALNWAREGGMPGIMLETQDTNSAACRFYERCGFKLGGVDTLLYAGFKNERETALFWYLLL